MFLQAGFEMDRRDQELLDKQLRRFNPSPLSDRAMVFAFLVAFFAAVVLSGVIFEYKLPV
jgi:hypothetical protein